MNIHVQGDLLAAILTFALALSMLLRGRPYRQQILFTVAALNIFFFHLTGFLCQIAAADIPGFWERLQYAMAAMIPITFTLLLSSFLPEGQTLGRGLHTLEYVLSPMLIIGTISPLLYRHPWFTTILGAYVYLTITFTYIGLIQGMGRTENENEKRKLAYLVTGGLLTLVLEIFTNMNVTRPYVPILGNTVMVVYLYFMSQAVIDYRVMGLKELFGKAIVLTSLAVVLSGVYMTLVVWVGSAVHLMVLNTLVASFVILVLFDPLRAALESAASKIILTRRFEFGRKLQALRRAMANLFDPKEMTEYLLDSLWATRRVTHAAVYLLADDVIGFKRSGHRGPPAPERMDVVSHRALVEHIQERKTPLLLEMVERRAMEEPAETVEGGSNPVNWQEIRSSMLAISANILLPLVAGGEVAGLLTLNDARTTESFTAEELSLLMQIADQAGVTLENYRLFERAKERDRLAAIGEMAAGLAHEIRNPLGAIKGAAQYLDPGSLPESEGEFIGIIIEEVDRLNRVLSQFLDYSRPFKGRMVTVDMNEVAEGTLRVLAPQIPDGIEVRKVLAHDLPQVNGDPEQLRQVLINLVLNAVQAMPGGGVLTVTTSSKSSPLDLLGPIGEFIKRGLRGAPSALVSVSDTGPGIPPENLRKIFIPFFTSKKDGTGLGLAICQKIVENHDGVIEVASEPGSGSTFLVKLPAVPPQKGHAAVS